MTASTPESNHRQRTSDKAPTGFDHSERNERGVVGFALAVAAVLHVAVLLFLQLPAASPLLEPTSQPSPPELKWLPLPPPPPPEAPVLPASNVPARRIPLPARELNSLEPIREAAPPVEFDASIPFDAGDLVDWNEPPLPAPPHGPYDAGTAGVSLPVLIGESKVEPLYPEIARRAGASARVVLRAVILADGTVARIEAISCTRPGLGFEGAAIDAVRHWRYAPATLHGRPVDAFLTVHVDFTLR